jgi:hypothetical protein
MDAVICQTAREAGRKKQNAITAYIGDVGLGLEPQLRHAVCSLEGSLRIPMVIVLAACGCARLFWRGEPPRFPWLRERNFLEAIKGDDHDLTVNTL